MSIDTKEKAKGKYGFGERVNYLEIGGWLVDAFRPGGVLKSGDAPKGAGELVQDVKIVDVDTHLSEPPDLWSARLPEGLKARAPYMKRIGDVDYWHIGDTVIAPGGASVIDKSRHKVLGRLSLPTLEQVHPGAYDVKARLAMMDDMGIHAQICYPNSFAASSVGLLNWVDREFAELMIQIYNDDRADRQKESGGRLFPMALLPVWDADAMAKEARRCVEDLNLRGFNLPDRPEQFGLPSLIHEHWAPLFELCDHHRVPINFHIATGGVDGFSLAWEGFEFERRLAVGSMLFYIGNAATIGNFILSGLFDKYPGLKMVSVESGIGWIPFVLEALEYQVDEMMPTRKLQRRPKEYFRDQMFASFWFEKSAPQRMLDIIGPDTVMFETDFPHPTSLYPDPQAHIAEALGDLDPVTRRKVLHDNAARCYNLDF